MKITNPLQAALIFAPFSLAFWALAAWAVSAILGVSFWTAVAMLIMIAVLGISFFGVWVAWEDARAAVAKAKGEQS